MPHGIDQRDTSGSTRTGTSQKFWRKRPERGDRGNDAGAEQDQGDNQQGCVLRKDARTEETDGTGNYQTADEFAALSTGIR
ncbi:hypothetical protein D9M71_817050 [compost metagenome]